MMTALIYFGASVGVLLLLSVLYLFEDARGGRIILPGVRNSLDSGLRFIIRWSTKLLVSWWNALVRLVLRYGVYQMLGALVTYLVTLEQKIERTIFRHKEVTNREDRPRNHLDEIADHKEAITLSEAERQRLRDE